MPPPTDDDDILIRNGTFAQFLRYEVVFFGKKSAGYALEGGLRIRGQWFVLAALLVGVALGVALGKAF